MISPAHFFLQAIKFVRALYQMINWVQPYCSIRSKSPPRFTDNMRLSRVFPMFLLISVSAQAFDQKIVTRYVLGGSKAPAPVLQEASPKPFEGLDRGPVPDLAIFSTSKDGIVWFGGNQGAARFDAKALHRWDRWQYFWGRRWLAGCGRVYEFAGGCSPLGATGQHEWRNCYHIWANVVFQRNPQWIDCSKCNRQQHAVAMVLLSLAAMRTKTVARCFQRSILVFWLLSHETNRHCWFKLRRKNYPR